MTAFDSSVMAEAIVEATTDAFWLLDVDGNTLYANEQFARLVGRTLAEVQVSDGYAFNDEQGRGDFSRHIEQMRAGHPGSVNDDVLLVRPDGQTVWTLVSWSPLRADDGALIGYLHRLTDYTDRRHLVEALTSSRLQLGEAQRIARLGSYTWDVADNRIVWSEELFRIYGLTREEFDGTFASFLDLIHPDDRSGVMSVVTTAVRQQESFEWEARFGHTSGEVRWMRGLGVVERNRDGHVVRVRGTGQDITDLRTADEVAAEAGRHLHMLQRIAEAANKSTTLTDALIRSATALAESSTWRPLGVWVQPDLDGPLSYLELPVPAARDLPGPDLDRASKAWHSHDVDVFNLEDRPGHSLITLPVLVTASRTACVIQLYADVDELDVGTWTLMRQICDQLSRVAERERIAVQLEEARDLAMEASRHKSEFLAVMSHEIRTPMNGVIGLNDLLLRTDLDEGQRRLAEGLRGAGLTLLTLINDILDLSKIESGRLELEQVDFDVRRVFDEVATVLAGPAQEKGIELVVGCHPDVPRVLRGDPVRLGQIIANLGSNAVKFTDDGEVVIEATVGEEDDDTVGGAVVLRVEVRDTGIGVDAEDPDLLFDAFTQADLSTTRRHGGTGLGLAISKRLTTAMGGEIGVRSARGAGSVFWFSATLGRPVGDVAPLGSARPLQHRRVLVVDDHPTAAAFCARVLGGWDMQADVATASADALAMLHEAAASGRPYELALVDLEMPDVDGLDLGVRIRSNPALADLRLVLLAGDPSTDVEEIAAAGYGAWTTKPIRESALQDALLDVTGHAREPAATRAYGVSLGLRVLVVEDNRVNQLVATGMLENLGCGVDIVENGADAVSALVTGHPYDVVLMDCRMPRMDGFEATRRVRAVEARDGSTPVTIIAMTASALAGERERCAEAGMDDFLAKPVDPVQLGRALTRVGPGGTSPTPSPAVAQPVPSATSTGGGALGVVLNPNRVAMLGELVKDGISFFERTRMSFLARIDGTLATLRIAMDDDDAPSAAATAHQLKGSALNLGLERVGVAAAAVEAYAATGTVTGMGGLLDTLVAAVTEGVEALVTTTTSP